MRTALRALLVALSVASVAAAGAILVPSAHAQSKLLDINTATQAELEALPGIGPVRAAAIIKGRPYKAKDELHEKKIISKGEYDKIKDKIIAKKA